jgi:hypothetical protein
MPTALSKAVAKNPAPSMPGGALTNLMSLIISKRNQHELQLTNPDK